MVIPVLYSSIVTLYAVLTPTSIDSGVLSFLIVASFREYRSDSIQKVGTFERQPIPRPLVLVYPGGSQATISGLAKH